MALDVLVNSRFEDKYIPEALTGCYLWTGSVIPSSGYGKMVMNDSLKYAHRISFEYVNGKIPRGMFVCHSCDNPSCVNPDHLFLGSPKDNTRDMIRKKRKPVGEQLSFTKLSSKDIFDIRNSSETNVELSRRYNVTAPHISRIKNRVRWTHI